MQQTLEIMNDEMGKDPRYMMHYAIKANANPIVLRHIKAAGLGIDCVSGGEIEVACNMGFESRLGNKARTGERYRMLQCGECARTRCDQPDCN